MKIKFKIYRPKGGTEEYMKKIYWRTVNGAVNMKNRVGEILKGEEGMGTVEVILIILVKWSRETCCAYSAWS